MAKGDRKTLERLLRSAWERQIALQAPAVPKMAKTDKPDVSGRKRLVDGILSFIFFAVPIGLGWPVIWKWVSWAVCWALLFGLVLPDWLPSIRRWNSTWKKLPFIVAMISFASFFPLVHSQWRTEQSQKLEGDLVPSHMFAHPEKDIEIGFRPNAVVLRSSNNPDQPLFMFLRDAGFSIGIKNGVPSISTPVRDRFGHLVAIIAENHWTVFPPYCLDKNYTNDTLEVLDSSGHVIIQVRVLGDRVQIQGEWRDEFGHGVELVDDSSEGKYIINWNNSTEEQEVERPIPLIFEYPSKDYWQRFRWK